MGENDETDVTARVNGETVHCRQKDLSRPAGVLKQRNMLTYSLLYCHNSTSPKLN
jgi:hypothetical protein